MNQTRLFLIFAWLMVAALLWMEWNKEHAAPAADATAIAATTTVPPAQDADAGASATPAVPRATESGAAASAAGAAAQRRLGHGEGGEGNQKKRCRSCPAAVR
jgi:YidC/Oxa1 family membrane protein insertase